MFNAFRLDRSHVFAWHAGRDLRRVCEQSKTRETLVRGVECCIKRGSPNRKPPAGPRMLGREMNKRLANPDWDRFLGRPENADDMEDEFGRGLLL